MTTTSRVVRATRPWWTQLGAWAVGVAALALGGAMLRAANGRGNEPGVGWWAVPVVLSLVALPAVALLAYLVMRRRNLRLELRGDQLSRYDVRGRQTTVERTRIAWVVEASLTHGVETRDVAILVGDDGAPLLALWLRNWDRYELTALWSALDRPVERIARPVAAARAEFPGLPLPVSFAHPSRTALIAVLCVFAYIAAWAGALVQML